MGCGSTEYLSAHHLALSLQKNSEKGWFPKQWSQHLGLVVKVVDISGGFVDKLDRHLWLVWKLYENKVNLHNIRTEKVILHWFQLFLFTDSVHLLFRWQRTILMTVSRRHKKYMNINVFILKQIPLSLCLFELDLLLWGRQVSLAQQRPDFNSEVKLQWLNELDSSQTHRNGTTMHLILSSSLSLLLQAPTVNSLQRRQPTGDKTRAIRCDISLCPLYVPQAMPLLSGCWLSARPIGRSPPLHFAAFTKIRSPLPPRELSFKTIPQDPLPTPLHPAPHPPERMESMAVPGGRLHFNKSRSFKGVKNWVFIGSGSSVMMQVCDISTSLAGSVKTVLARDGLGEGGGKRTSKNTHKKI